LSGGRCNVGAMETILRLDMHQLIPRFAALRLRDPERLGGLVQSLRQHGQLVPVVAVPESAEDTRWVLIDGYRRLEALQQIGADRIWVDVWACAVDEALLLCLAKGSERGLEAIEEAALLHTLSARYSLRELARRIGRDASWVSRRLNLFKALPDDLLNAVRNGTLSLWAATRILAPLARANSTHAQTLLSELEKTPLSTRELAQLFTHYQQAPQTQRERLVTYPGLFVQTLDARRQSAEDQRLAAGPEGAWCKDLGIIANLLKRLIPLVPTLFDPAAGAAQKQRLMPPWEQTRGRFQSLDQALQAVPRDDQS
jgi:ParB family chromosome partitioning protein